MKTRNIARASLALAAAFVLGSPLVFPSFARAEDVPASQPAKVDAIDFRKLKEALPEALGDLKRTKTEGQKMKVGEQSISTAKGTYGDAEAENAPHGEMNLIDYGTTDLAAGFAGMLSVDIDNESDTEWTKTVKIDEHKALMTYNKENKHGSVQTAAGGRILVTLELNNVTEEQFKKSAETLPLKKLDELVK